MGCFSSGRILMSSFSKLSLLFAAMFVCLGQKPAVGQNSRSDGEILRPEAAFPYELNASSNELTIRFQIPEGYYLYRERFEFESSTPGISLGEPRFPEGKIYEDEFFGKMEIYRGGFEIDIPYQRPAGLDNASVTMILQGCADIGLCYPPQRWARGVSLPDPGNASPFANFFGSRTDNDEILPVDEAFTLDSRVDGPNQITLSWRIEPGYYLYRDHFEFTTDSNIQLGTPRIPAGVFHNDEYFGDTEIFFNYVEVALPFARANPEAIPIVINTTYQGCKESSICYPAVKKTASLQLPASGAFSAALADPKIPISEQDRLATVILGGSWWKVIGTFYLAGLLLAFTPCVLPMVPILSSIIGRQHENEKTNRAFSLSFAYVMGMAITYTVAGALAAMAGQQAQAMFQKPWIIGTFAGLFFLLALSMLGAYELQMPNFIQTRLSNLANRQKAGTYAGTVVMGSLSALIVTTCIAPPLVATLAVIGQSGEVLRGAGALFILSLGMGSPLLLIGASGGKLLPKAGPWMSTVKAGFGIMMIGLSIWMLERILSSELILICWALLVLLTGLLLGAHKPLPIPASPLNRMSKGVGLVACLYAALMLVGATLGGKDPLRPIPQGAFLANTGNITETEYMSFRELESLSELEGLLAQARLDQTPVMLDFTADWCVSCKEMEKYTFPDQSVQEALTPYLALRADVTENNQTDRELLQHFGIFGPPTIAFFNREGEELTGFRLVGFISPEEFSDHIREAAAL